MAYELYQSRHKGYEIDNLLDDVVDLNSDVAALKTEYDANKVKMSDGTILPLHLVNTYATKTELSAKADSTQVAADIATATTDMATNTGVASAIATATADMATQTQVASDIATATTDMATNASVASAIAAAAYTLPEATTSTLGGVKPDGTTITVDNDGTIHGAQSLPTGGTSGQVLKKKSATNYDVEWADESGGGGGGGGHTIVDTDGTAVAQENKLQFKGLSVTDDSTNGTTKVEGIGLNADSINDIATTTPEVPSVIIGDSNNYSTSEKIIGKWIDGKPIYQKTFSITPRRAVWSQQYCAVIETTPQEYNIPNVDCIIQGMCYTNGWDTLNGKYGAYTCGAQKNVSSNNINFLLLDSARVYACTLQYTKTTD